MSLTWGRLRQLFLEGAGNTGSGDAETWIHLTEGYRRVAEPLDIPDLVQPESTYTLAIGEDFFPSDADVYAIKTLVNLTDGVDMLPEPGGMTGRNRFIEPTAGTHGKPPEGSVTHWVRDGGSIYVRGTPKVATTVAIRYKVQVPELDASYVNFHPLTPPQYDMAIYHAAVVSYYGAHPERDSRGEGEAFSKRDRHRQDFSAILGNAGKEAPRKIESRSARNSTRLAGYQVRSFR